MSASPPPIRYPTLSFLELKTWTSMLRPILMGARIERVFVPSMPEHPDLYFKKEWALDLHLPQSSHTFYFSLRPQATGFLIVPSKQLKSEGTGSRSGFDLSLHKFLTGGRISNLEVIEGERIVVMQIQSNELYELHLHLIPAKPLGILIRKEKEEVQVVAATDNRETYLLPEPRTLTEETLKKIPNRPEITENVPAYAKAWFAAQKSSALLLRSQRLLHALQTKIESARSKIKSLEMQLQQTEIEPDWNYFGSLLQTHYHAKPTPLQNFYELMDYEKEKIVRFPADPKLNAKQQLERFFHLAKRKKKRLEETALRISTLREKEAELFDKIKILNEAQTLSELLNLEPKKEVLKGKEQKKLAEFSGKQYRSKEGLTILAGRNLTENLELTFKIARGNDLWFHVKGRPGSHTVVILPAKRSASLDTLLDAAHLCILHSGGKDWGKTEVDYTFRKHVKKIKNQPEVTYTHNKTLMIIPEPERLTRLYGSE